MWRGATLRRVREWIGNVPPIGRELSRRRVRGIPEELIQPRWRWELPRAIAGRFSTAGRVEDWLWERGEFDLDRVCAAVVRRPEVGGFFGVEHGALRAIEAAQDVGKPAAVAFLSAHRQTRERWVDAEFVRHPELRRPRAARLEYLAADRDERRDAEARRADWIVSGSSFTTRSLVDAGIDAGKILTVPLGGPNPVPVHALPSSPSDTFRIVFVGGISVHKGAHYLLRAWPRLAGSGVELHFYGSNCCPIELIAAAKAAPGGDRLFFHGSVAPSTLERVYLDSDLLVLPTLCDGFGQVITDALAHGLPVLTTTNAGAADCVEDGITGFIIPPADEAALEARLAWCLAHRPEVFDMHAAARAAAANWTWAHFRRKFAADMYTAVGAPTEMPALRALA